MQSALKRHGCVVHPCSALKLQIRASEDDLRQPYPADSYTRLVTRSFAGFCMSFLLFMAKFAAHRNPGNDNDVWKLASK